MLKLASQRISLYAFGMIWPRYFLGKFHRVFSEFLYFFKVSEDPNTPSFITVIPSLTPIPVKRIHKFTPSQDDQVNKKQKTFSCIMLYMFIHNVLCIYVLKVRKCLVIKLFVFWGQVWLCFWKLSKREESFKELGNDIALNLPA